MSEIRRAYDILRGYIGREWERIQGVEHANAMRELETPGTYVPRPTADPDATPAPMEDQMSYARRILGVSESSSFEEIRKAFERLDRRSDPANFPDGSPESIQASEIRRRIQTAYRLLTEGVDSTEKRFKTLEID